ncbi:MAG TPA: pilus assembly protein TadG-related protein [Sphingomicrobium sp.]|nr:pilus assembly protein TadG-related protein [Sphingomicrobium sp.]
MTFYRSLRLFDSGQDNRRQMGKRDLPIRKSLWRNEGGNTLVLAALMFPLIVGSAGLAVDTTMWILTKRQIQQAADAAAIAGSYEAVQEGDVDYAVDKALAPTFAKIRDLSAQTTLTPDDRDGDPFAVGVRLTTLGSLPFSSMFLRRPITISASATATVVETGDFCALAMGSSAETGLRLQPNTSVEAECGIATNSSASNAVSGHESSTMTVPKLLASGGIEGGAAMAGSRVRAYALKQKDPLASINPPEVPNTGCPNVTVNASSERQLTLKPGCYGNLIINGSVTLEPGNYILNRGNLVVGSSANVTCDGCSIFLTSEDADADSGSIGRVRIDKAASMKLSAPTTGPYAGILLFQDRRAGADADDETNVISGDQASKFEGAVYFPSQSLKMVGTGSSNFNCARIIGRRLILEGQIFIAKSCSTDTGGIALKGAEVRLVE